MHFFSTVGENAPMAVSQLMQDNNTRPDIPSATASDSCSLHESEMFKFKHISCTDVKKYHNIHALQQGCRERQGEHARC